MDRIAKTVSRAVYIMQGKDTDHGGDAIADLPELVSNYTSGVVAVELFGEVFADTPDGYMDRMCAPASGTADMTLKEKIGTVENDRRGYGLKLGLLFNPADNSCTVLYSAKNFGRKNAEALVKSVERLGWDDTEIMEFGELPG